MSLMGHTDCETTVSDYTDVQADMKAKGDAQLQAWLMGQNVGTGSEHDEYEELRKMAEDVARVIGKARKELQETGAVPLHHVEKLVKYGLGIDALK